MGYWLLKTEPTVFSYDTLVRDGRSVWDGVTNALALQHLRAMKKGDQAFIYHTGKEKALVGTARLLSAPYPDPSASDPRLVVVDIGPGDRLSRPVPLSEIRADKRFADLGLVRLPRLSVMPVSAAHWAALTGLAGRPTGGR